MAEETSTETQEAEGKEAQTEGTQETQTQQTQETKPAETQAKEPKETDDSLLGEKGKEGDEGKKETETPQEKVVPEKYEFKAPEGMELDEGFLEEATPVLKELKLGQDEAGKLFDLMVKKTQADAQRWTETVDGWKENTIKELGEDYQEKLSVTSQFIDKFAGKRSDEVRQILNDTGVGSHPAVVHLFIEAGKFFGSDNLATGDNKNQPSDPERLAQKMFPNTKY